VARWNAHQGRGWQTWAPDDDGDAARARLAAAELQERVLQFFARRQWQQARMRLKTMGVRLMGDIPFIVGTESADVWAHQAEFRREVSLGCPPDAFAAEGQDWSLPAYDFQAMQKNQFRFLRARTRAARDLFDAFRLDHVVGYFRMWLWNHAADGSRTGAFDLVDEPSQQSRGRSLLQMMQEEAGPEALIAEDLGVIPGFVRATLTELQIPGYKVIPWERDGENGFIDPRAFPSQSVATYSTHDTQPIDAWWNEFTEPMRRDLLRLAARRTSNVATGEPPGATGEASPGDRNLALMRLLCASGSSLVLVLFEELLGRTGRINVPGTVNAQNWTLRLHAPLEELLGDPAMLTRLATMHRLLVESSRA
jgi:4-alpha-glucanotransferase